VPGTVRRPAPGRGAPRRAGNGPLTVTIAARTCEKGAAPAAPPQLAATRCGVPPSHEMPTVSPGQTPPRPGLADTRNGAESRPAENTLRYIE